MMEQKTKNAGSSLWFWIGALTLALVIFISSASIISFIERYSTIAEWPILGMLVVMVPLTLFGIYCLKRGKDNVYSLKADLLPMLIISLFFGLGKLAPPGSIGYYWGWTAVPILVFVFLPIYLLHRRALRKMGIVNILRSER